MSLKDSTWWTHPFDESCNEPAQPDTRFSEAALLRTEDWEHDKPNWTRLFSYFRVTHKMSAEELRPKNLSEIYQDLIAAAQASDVTASTNTPIVSSFVYGNSQEKRRIIEKARNPDGPVPPKQFRWKGVVVDVEPIPWRLINALWGQEKMMLENLESAVWGDHEFSDGKLKAAIYKANAALLEACCPSQISRSGEWVLISS